MKIRKYFAADMRQALNLAREEQGEDVVILSNRKVIGGVELVAVEDYDEALFRKESTFDEKLDITVRSEDLPADEKESDDKLHGSNIEFSNNVVSRKHDWNDEPALAEVRKEINSLRDLLKQQMSGLAWGEVGREHPLWAGLLRKFGKLGIHPAIARELVHQIPEDYTLDKAWRTALALLSYKVPVTNKSTLSSHTALSFCGASGSGKTTTIAKLATQYVLQHGVGSIVLATLDSYRVGGKEQLRSYSRILGVPMRSINSSEDMEDLLEQFHGRKLILVDTAGFSPGDQRYKEQITLLRSAGSKIQHCLILPASAQTSALQQTVGIYRPLSPTSCIISKLDEASSIGTTLSISIREKLTVLFQCDGQQVPENIKKADAGSLIARAISMMKKLSVATDEELLEQDFGKYAVYNRIGEGYEH